MSKLIEALLSRQYVTLILIALLLLGGGINSYSLRGSTEPREAGIAAEMLQNSQYVVPRLNGQAFLEKPPLSYWLQAAALHAFGYKPFAVRLPSIIAGIACLCALFVSLNKIYSRDMAWLGATLLLTMASFWMNARMAGQDALLTFGVALALLAFNSARLAPARLTAWLIYTAGIAIAVLTKGVVGLAVLGVVIFSYLIIETCLIERRFIWSNWWRPAVFALMGILPFAVWLWLLDQREGGNGIQQILWANSIGRFTGDYQLNAHAEPFYYYLKKLPETFFPWNLLLFIALWQMRRMFVHDRNTLFFSCWLVAPFILLSLSAGKRPSYLLMIYPAAAALIVLFAYRLRGAMQNNREKPKLYWLGVLQTSMVSAVAVFMAARIWQLHARAAAIVLVVVLAMTITALWRACISRQWRVWACYGVLSMLAVYAVYGGAALRHEKRDESPELIFVQMRTLQQDGYSLALYAPIERIAGAANFYLQRSLPEIRDASQLQALFKTDHHTAVLVAESDIGGLNDYRVLASFLDQKRKYLIVAGAAVTP